MFWHDFRAICAELIPKAVDGEIVGVGVSGIGPCIVPADASGQPLRPTILYGIDTRSSANWPRSPSATAKTRSSRPAAIH